MCLYKISQVSKELGFSKVTIYKKLKIFHKELKPYIKIRGNVKYISQEGIDFLKTILTVKDMPSQPDTTNQAVQAADSREEYISSLLEKIDALSEEIHLLRNNLEEKENLILNQASQLQNLYSALKKEQEKSFDSESKKSLSFRLFKNR